MGFAATWVPIGERVEGLEKTEEVPTKVKLLVFGSELGWAGW